jgi:hypothetical protein
MAILAFLHRLRSAMRSIVHPCRHRTTSLDHGCAQVKPTLETAEPLKRQDLCIGPRNQGFAGLGHVFVGHTLHDQHDLPKSNPEVVQPCHFLALPTELRLCIYEHFSSPPRLIDIEIVSPTQVDKRRRQDHNPSWSKRPDPLPPLEISNLLLVCSTIYHEAVVTVYKPITFRLTIQNWEYAPTVKSAPESGNEQRPLWRPLDTLDQNRWLKHVQKLEISLSVHKSTDPSAAQSSTVRRPGYAMHEYLALLQMVLELLDRPQLSRVRLLLQNNSSLDEDALDQVLGVIAQQPWRGKPPHVCSNFPVAAAIGKREIRRRFVRALAEKSGTAS